MAGKPQITPDELAKLLATLRSVSHLTFKQACSYVGKSDSTVRYMLEQILPRYKEIRPDLDYSIPNFAMRGARVSPLTIAVAGRDPASSEGKDAVIQRLQEELREARSKLISADREYADHRFIKQKLYELRDSSVIQPDWLVKPKKSIKSPGIPAMMWSDWHWGEVVDPFQVNGVNKYDLSIAQERARKLVERTIVLLRQYMVSPSYEGVVVNLGGDMFSGNIHEELVSTNATPIMSAVVDLWGVLEWCLKTMADEFGKVAVFCVTGNHGRDTKKIQSKDRAFTSFDWLVYMHLQHAFRNDKRITVVAPVAPDVLYAVYDHRYLLTHGDQFRGGDGMIGHIGPVTRGQKKKLSRNAEIDQEFDTMIHGHFHTYSPGDRILGNGSLVGYSEYSNSNNFGFEEPRQAMWITHPKHGITFHCPVLVDEKEKEETTRWVSWMEAK